MSAQAVLFDAPGPRARRRNLILTIVGVVLTVVVAYLVGARMAATGQLEPSLWTPFLEPGAWTSYLIPGLIGTLKATFFSVILAGIFGLLFGMGRLSPVRAVRWACGIVVEFFRAVPVLLMMVFAYFGVFARADWIPNDQAPLAAVVTGLTLYNGAVIAELVRSGVDALPRGQSEAGLSIGLTPQQTLNLIQLPQALTAMLPALVAQLVVVLKDSALGIAVTYPDLLNWAKTLGSAYANTVPAYLVAGALFIILDYALMLLARWLERRLKRRGAAGVLGADPLIVQGLAEPGVPAADGLHRAEDGVEHAVQRAQDHRAARRQDM
ncbi:MAG: amino acid ABC transporter permease [Austwickia sp.]|nr:amino acid ABC transporter permease [Austwickia sp.]